MRKVFKSEKEFDNAYKKVLDFYSNAFDTIIKLLHEVGDVDLSNADYPRYYSFLEHDGTFRLDGIELENRMGFLHCTQDGYDYYFDWNDINNDDIIINDIISILFEEKRKLKA